MLLDFHLDLAMNALEWNRDLTRPLTEINARERNFNDRPDRGRATVSLPEMRRGGIGLCVATQIARYVHHDNPLPGWNSAEQAWAHTQGQLAWYRTMEAKGEMVQITDLQGLEAHLQLWKSPPPDAPIGYILSLEGADSIVDISYVEKAYQSGLRAIGPAHYGPGTYAHGTESSGGLGSKGRELLREMERLGIILDATHLCDESFWEAMHHFHGPVWSSHTNSRALVPDQRQFTDDQFRVLIERGAVLGMPLDAWMMVPGWERGMSDPRAMGCDLEVMVDHIDHVCQLAGNSQHVGLGTDLDGGFGREQCPYDLETIADLQKVPYLLQKRGYSEGDVENIMGRNWVNFLRRVWG